jgi:hypothetical protein
VGTVEIDFHFFKGCFVEIGIQSSFLQLFKSLESTNLQHPQLLVSFAGLIDLGIVAVSAWDPYTPGFPRLP